MRLSLSQDNAGAALVFHPFLGLAMRLVNPDRDGRQSGWARPQPDAQCVGRFRCSAPAHPPPATRPGSGSLSKDSPSARPRWPSSLCQQCTPTVTDFLETRPNHQNSSPDSAQNAPRQSLCLDGFQRLPQARRTHFLRRLPPPVTGFSILASSPTHPQNPNPRTNDDTKNSTIR